VGACDSAIGHETRALPGARLKVAERAGIFATAPLHALRCFIAWQHHITPLPW
jgi:hypothetical protein